MSIPFQGILCDQIHTFINKNTLIDTVDLFYPSFAVEFWKVPQNLLCLLVGTLDYVTQMVYNNGMAQGDESLIPAESLIHYSIVFIVVMLPFLNSDCKSIFRFRAPAPDIWTLLQYVSPDRNATLYWIVCISYFIVEMKTM